MRNIWTRFAPVCWRPDGSRCLYDAIGRTYDTTRKADPSVTRCLARHAQFAARRASYLDIGCGTGNYTVALQNLGARMHGLELTSTMLAKARLKSDRVRWVQGNAESLPFPDRCFDGAIATVTIHHMKNPWRGFEEVFRVIVTGRFVIFTGDHAQMNGYWLNEYFPVGIAAAIKQMPRARRRGGSSRARRIHRGREWSRGKFRATSRTGFCTRASIDRKSISTPHVRAGISLFAQGV